MITGSPSMSALRQMQTLQQGVCGSCRLRGALDCGDAPAWGVPQAPEPAQTGTGLQVWSQPGPYGRRRLACTAGLAEACRPGA